MGISNLGTVASKESSQMILANDKLSSICNRLEEQNERLSGMINMLIGLDPVPDKNSDENTSPSSALSVYQSHLDRLYLGIDNYDQLLNQLSKL